MNSADTRVVSAIGVTLLLGISAFVYAVTGLRKPPNPAHNRLRRTCLWVILVAGVICTLLAIFFAGCAVMFKDL